MLLQETPAVLSLENSAMNLSTHITGEAVRIHISSKMARELIAISERMRQEHQVGSLNHCTVRYSNMLMLTDWNYKTHNTDTLNLDENKCVYKKNYF